MKTMYSLLALGDSYTIGEAVPLFKNFPYQAAQFLRKKGFDFLAPEILAKTGWTTDELQKAIQEYSFLNTYDFVTLLIGVNNQYRNYSIETYEKEFSALLSKAILLAKNNPDHVFVLSIPDYSVTTFARELDRDQITAEIERYNEVCQKVSQLSGTQYLDITTSSKEAANDQTLLAADGLHPSEKEYLKWAAMLGNAITYLIKNINI